MIIPGSVGPSPLSARALVQMAFDGLIVAEASAAFVAHVRRDSVVVSEVSF